MITDRLDLATLPRWAIGLLIFLLCAVVPALSHLLDLRPETEAAQAVADDKADAIAQAQRVARIGDAP